MLYVFILIIPLLVYAVFSALILFHLKKYGIIGDFTKQIIILFFIVSIVLIFFTIISFSSIEWNELNLEDIFQNVPSNNIVF